MEIRDRIQELVRVRARDLVPNRKNWRRHPKAQADALRGLLSEIGYADAVLVRRSPSGSFEIIDGHLRAETTPDDMIPALVLDVTEAEADKLLATLDPLAAMAESDAERLAALLKSVQTASPAVTELLRRTAGDRVWQIVHPSEINELEVSIDRADELMEKWKTETDQLWWAGPHRLICADCTNAVTIDRLWASDGSPFRLLLTDSPYGVRYASKNEFLNKIDRGNRVQRPIVNDDSPEVAPSLFAAALRSARERARVGAACYATVPGGELLPEFIEAFNSSGFTFKSLLVWVKNHFVLGRSDYQFRHENILYGWIENGPHYFVNDRTQSSVFEIEKPHTSELHPTQKPVVLLSKLIANSSCPGDVVFDPFAGSGSTLMAAHQLGRVAYSCEIEPAYLAVQLERLSMLGLTPKLMV